ncbi:MAG: efflux RND transporter permease subunit [Pseudomonadota bacterium]
MIRRSLPDGGVLSLFARHPNAANLLMVLMIIFGLFAIARINTQFFPTVETNTVSITVKWTGASAEDVESNVIEIIEPEVRFIDGVKDMTSYAREGSGTISLEFNAGTDMNQATADVDAAVKTVTNLPDEADTPEVAKRAFFDSVARLAVSGDVPEPTLRIIAKQMRDDLIERGIDKVDMTGLRDEEYQVKIPERELRRLGLSVQDVSDVISRNSRDTPSGQLRTNVEKQIRALADVDDPENLEDIEILSFSSGEKVLLGDFAEIRRGYEDGQVQGFSGGKRAIQLTVQRAPTAGTLKTAAVLESYLQEIEGNLPAGITLTKYEVRADRLVERISLLFWNGVFGLVLVIGTLFIFLNARIAFWVAVGIPVAMFATLGFMLLMGQSVNMITLFALIMMLGVIVDDAIVVGEHTASRFEAGDGAFEAAENGAGRMLTPVMAAMITTIAAFAPMFLIRDVLGQIIGVMPYVVIAVIIASLIECFLILPGHLAHTLEYKPKRRWSYWRQVFVAAFIGGILIAVSNRISTVDPSVTQLGPIELLFTARTDFSTPIFLAMITLVSLAAATLVEGMFRFLKTIAPKQKSPDEEGWFRRNFDRIFSAFRDGVFDRMVRTSYRWRYVTVAFSISCALVFAFGLMRGEHVKFIFFPSPEAENIQARIVYNAGISEPSARAIINGVESALYLAEQDLTGGDEKLFTAVFTTLGSAGQSRGDNLAQMRVQLVSSEIRTIRTPEIIKAWRKQMPKLPGLRRIAVFESRVGPPGRDLDLEITGGDAATLKQAARRLIPIVSSIDGVSGVSDDLPYGKPELVMELTPRGAALGFGIDEVGKQVRNAFDGAIPRRFAKGDDEITIRVSQTTRNKGSSQLMNFELRSPAGEFVPLEEVVSLKEKQGFSAIQREDGNTIVSITGDLDTDVITTEKAIEILNAGEMPRIIAEMGLDYRYGGRDEERKLAFADLLTGTYAALAIIYIVLAWVFGNYFRPIAIMLIIPFGLVGAVFGHWVLGYQLTILSLIGLLGLAGILVNDSIILVSRLDERLDEGENLEEAAIGASRDRLRAVLLTSLTTIGGLFPLMFEKSLQAQFLLPMAITIVFGLAIATLLVLFLVPSFIGIGGDIKWLLNTVFGERHIRSKVQPAE